MKQRIKIFPYRQGSHSAKLLADTLGGRVLKVRGSSFKPRAGDLVINWGAGELPAFNPARVLNADTATASNKLRSFQALREAEVSIPPFWTDRTSFTQDDFPVVCRSILRGHSGAGIVVADNADQLVNCPLYVKYVKKAQEYRVHVANGDVILVQRKAKKSDREDVDWRIRNLAGGFVFVLCDRNEVPQDALEQSIIATRALGLDFGAVDVIFNQKQNKSYVLETNCAPGLEQRTADAYAAAFRSI